MPSFPLFIQFYDHKICLEDAKTKNPGIFMSVVSKMNIKRAGELEATE